MKTCFKVTIGKGGVSGILWIETRDAAKHSTVHRTASPPHRITLAPRTKNYPALSIKCAEVEGPRASQFHITTLFPRVLNKYLPCMASAMEQGYIRDAKLTVI